MGEDAGFGWCTIESDPGVFTEILREVGVQDVQVEELFSLDADSLRNLGEVFGVIFLFKWKVPDAEKEKMDRGDDSVGPPADIYFANQVINNACATQAILSIVMNSSLDIGEELRNFKEFTKKFDPYMKGLAISNLQKVRTAHNSFAPKYPFVVENQKAEKDDDVYHFISYIEKDDYVYELDGTKPGPIRRGKVVDGNWLSACAPIICERMEEYSANEIRFNVMAVVKNREKMYEQELQALRERLAVLQAEMEGEDDQKRKDEISVVMAAIAEKEGALAEEKRKQSRWKKENTRRKHNYVPFVMEFLKLLASKGELNNMIEKAKEEKRRKLTATSTQQS